MNFIQTSDNNIKKSMFTLLLHFHLVKNLNCILIKNKDESDKENIIPISETEDSFVKDFEKINLEENIDMRPYNINAIYNKTLELDEKIKENISNYYSDKNIQEMDIYAMSEKIRLEKMKNIYLSKNVELDTYNTFLNEISIKQILLDSLFQDDNKKNFSLILINKLDVEIGFIQKISNHYKENKHTEDEDEVEGEEEDELEDYELGIIGYSQNKNNDGILHLNNIKFL